MNLKKNNLNLIRDASEKESIAKIREKLIEEEAKVHLVLSAKCKFYLTTIDHQYLFLN